MKKARWCQASLVSATALCAGAAILGLTTASADPGTVLKFDTMAPVTGPYVGSANPIRGLNGGGLPWMITAGNGVLKQDGRLVLHVRGLVLANHAPVPPALQGTNPITSFRAIVSCQTISSGSAAVSNVRTDPFPASSEGNADVETAVALPSPCIAPIVFVTSPGGAWFAATGN